MRNRKTLLALAGFATATIAAGVFGSRYSPERPSTRAWYRKLAKPTFNPPNYVFPFVWSSLYALMSLSAWRAWRQQPSSRRNTALALWSAQLGTNAIWTKLFFGERNPKLALADVVALETLILSYIVTVFKVDRQAAILFMPYAAWVGFATLLNAEIVRLNPS